MTDMPSIGQIIAVALSFGGAGAVIVVAVIGIYQLLMKIKPINEWYTKKQREKAELMFGRGFGEIKETLSESLQAIREEERLKRERIYGEIGILEGKLENVRKEFMEKILRVEEELDAMQTSKAVQEEQLKNLYENFTDKISDLCTQMTVVYQHLINK